MTEEFYFMWNQFSRINLSALQTENKKMATLIRGIKGHAVSVMYLPLTAVQGDHRKKLVSSKLQFALKVYLRDLL